jgi:hypothetical protein
VVWGTAFCLPLGFSFTALRVSTLVAGLIGLLAIDAALKEIGVDRRLRLVAILTVAVNPMYVALASSFNSDIPSVALYALAMYASVRSLMHRSRPVGVFAVALGLTAVLQRQSNVVLLPALGLAYLASETLTLRRAIVGAAPTALALAAQWSYAFWLEASGRRPLLYGLQVERLLSHLRDGPSEVAATVALNSLYIIMYGGLFLLPVLLVVYVKQLQCLARNQQLTSVVTVAAAVGTGFVLLGGRRMPLTGNVLERAGVGPRDFATFDFSLGQAAATALDTIWLIVTILALAGAVLLVGAISATLSSCGHGNSRRRLVTIYAVTLASLTGATIVVLPSEVWFDRYLLAVLAPLLIVTTLPTVTEPHSGVPREPGRGLRVVTIVALAVAGIVTAMSTRDYLAANRAKAVVLRAAIDERRIPPEQIDAGWQFSGWYVGHRIETCNLHYDRHQAGPPGWDDFACLFRGADSPYALQRHVPPDHEIIMTTTYQLWLPWQVETLYVLRRPL